MILVECVCAGASIGFVALVLLNELEFCICRLCTCFWLSVAYCFFSSNWLGLGVVNLAAHVTFLALLKVAYDDSNLNLSSGSETPTEESLEERRAS